MTPRADECEEDELSTSEDDDGFKEDMDALVRACRIAGTNPDDLKSPSAIAPDDEHADAVARNAQDPLLGAGDALAPVTDSDDEQNDLQYLKRVQDLYQPLSLKPLRTLLAPTLSDDDEDDLETLRAILNRFSAYDRGPHEDSVDKMAEGAHASSLGCEEEIANSVTSKESDPNESCPVFQDAIETTNLLTGNVERQPCNVDKSYKPDACKPSKLPDKRSKFPVSAQVFIDAIRKNRSFQRLLRSKLIQIEAKMEENKRLRERVKLLKDFQVSCIRRTGQALSQKKDPRVQLISTKRSPASSNSKINDKKISAMCYGPAENAHVIRYRMVLERFPLSLDRKKWSSVEKENLAKGIKQQFQEIVLQISVNQVSSEWSFGDANDVDNILASIKDLEITPESIRKFLPKVNWDRLASMYIVGRTGAECEARWLNCEDPLINHSPWNHEEDKFLLHTVQEIGSRNWFEIAASLNTNRTPFQCLARYQRSLNPYMLNSEWTEEEDAQLCSAVAIFGVSNWQSVASILERRTGTQCSNRWKKSLCPERKGGYTPEEDERLTVAVHLFGRKWSQIAKFVPGRTQAQCRDRYVNSLDPSLKWGGWTKEEDSRLKAAIAKHGFCWSKIAADVPPRTDSQCRKRWRVLCPDQVPMLQAARKMQKSTLISNFVDRESERPCLSLNDFLPLSMLGSPSDADAVNLPRKRKSKSSNISKKIRPKKRAKKTQNCLKEVQGDNVEPCRGHDVHKPKITEPHLEDNSVEAVCDHSPSDSVLTTTNGQRDLIGHNDINKIIDSKPIWKCCNELHEENHTRITPHENPESGTTNGHCINNRGKTCKHHGDRKFSAKDTLKHHIGRKSMLSASISDGEAVGSKVARNAISKKGRKKIGKRNKMIQSTETAEDPLFNKMSKPGSLSSVQILVSRDEDSISLASFLHNRSKRRFKNTKQVTQTVIPSTTSSSDLLLRMHQVENQIPSVVQHDMSQTYGADTEISQTRKVNANEPKAIDQVIDQNASAHGGERNSQGVKVLTDHGDGNMKSQKCSQAAKRIRACLSSTLKKGSGLLPEEVHRCHDRNQEVLIMQGTESDRGCIDVTPGTLLARNHSCNLNNMSTIEADDNGKAMSEPVEEQTIVLHGATEPKKINVDGEDESTDITLASFLKKKGRRQERAAKYGVRPSHEVAK